MTITKEQAILELKKRGKDVSMYETPNISGVQSNLNNSSSSISKEQAIEELRRRGKDVSMYEIPSSSTAGWGEKALGLGKGFVSGIGGGAADLASLAYNIPAGIYNFNANEANILEKEHPGILQSSGMGEYYGAQPIPTIPSAVSGLEKGIESLTGIQTPEDIRSLYEGTKFAGELLGSGGIGAIARKIGQKGIGKVLSSFGATSPSELVGATAAGTAMHHVGEEYGPLAAIPAGAVAGALGMKGINKLTEFGKTLSVPSKASETIGEQTIGRALSLLGKPSSEIEHIAKQEGLNLPFNIRLSGPVSNFLANTALNTIFTSKKWKNQIEETPKAILDKVINKIDEISPKNLGRERSSAEYRDLLKEEYKDINDKAKELYGISENYLKPDDKIGLNNTVKALNELRNKYDVYSASSPMKFVMKKVNELGLGLGIVSPKKGLGYSDIEKESPELFNKIIDALSKNEIKADTRKMINQRQAFLEDTKYGDVRGTKASLGHLIGAIDKDIDTTKNKDFLNNWRAANSFYKNEVANRMRDKLSESLKREKMPVEAYDYMNSPEEIKELHRILGNSSQSNQIMNALKRSKLKDVIEDTIMGADKEINFGAFANLFNKKNDKQELLKELLGEKSYKDLRDISYIASAYSKAGKQFANASGSATRATDLMRLGSIIPIIASGGVGASSLGASIAAPYMMSRILSNPRYTDAAVRYAMARQKGNRTESELFQKKMRDVFYDYARKETPPTLNQQIESEQ